MRIPEGEARAVGLDEAPGRRIRTALRRQELRAEAGEQIDASSLWSTHAHEQPGTPPEAVEGNAEANLYFARACACIDRGQYHLAVTLLIRVIHRVGNRVEPLHRLGFAYAELGQSSRAIECFDRVIRLAPYWSEAWSNRGWNRLRLRDYQGAMLDLLKAVELDSGSAVAWSHLGLCYMRLKQYDQAALAFEHAFTYQPGNEVHLLHWAQSLVKLDDREAAVLRLREARVLRPQFVRAWVQLLMIEPSALVLSRYPVEVPSQPLHELPPELKLPNMGRVIRRENRLLDRRAAKAQERLNQVWAHVQNPVAWIVVFVLAALLYILFGN